MKSLGMFLATSCLGIALATGAAAQETQQPPPQTQDQQTQQEEQQRQQQQEQQQREAQQQQTDQDQLPRTASPMPLAALAGMLSLGAAVIVRKLRK